MLLRIFFTVFLPACAFAGSIPNENNDCSNSTGLPDGIWHSKPGNPAIQWCIEHASDGDTVLVYPGTYYEHLDFLGKAIVVKGVAGAEETVIDGGGVGSVVTFLSGEDTTSILEGLTLRNGGGTEYLHDYLLGGGIYANESSLKILDCRIVNNVIGSINNHSSGGGLNIYRSDLVMRDCIISNNEAQRGGGGSISNVRGIISGCRFTGNVAFGEREWGEYDGGEGGALHLSNCDGLLVCNNEFSNNTAPHVEAGESGSCGGALKIRDGSPEIRNNLFIRNEAENGGAIKVSKECSSLIYGNLFLFNRAGTYWYSGSGGGIECFGDDAFAGIYNNTFFGNGAYPGIYGEVYGGSVTHLRTEGGVINNIFLETRSGRALTYGFGTPHHHNCYWNNADGDVYIPGAGSIFEDPLTDVDKAFLLPGDSPCIDAGIKIAGLDEYYCGENPDMGAREYCGLVSVRPGFIIPDSVAHIFTDSLGGSALQGDESKSDRFRIVNRGVILSNTK